MPTTVTDTLSGPHTYVPPPRLALTTTLHGLGTRCMCESVLGRPGPPPPPAPRVKGVGVPNTRGRRREGQAAANRTDARQGTFL